MRTNEHDKKGPSGCLEGCAEPVGVVLLGLAALVAVLWGVFG